jgi:hypothetical protein
LGAALPSDAEESDILIDTSVPKLNYDKSFYFGYVGLWGNLPWRGTKGHNIN